MRLRAGKGLTPGYPVCNVLLCFCHFPMWCPGSGVVLECIDSFFLTLQKLGLQCNAFGCLNGVARIDFLTKAHRLYLLTPFGDQNTQISLNVISNYNNGDFSH